MNRRPFLQKLAVAGTSLATMPFVLYGKMDFPKATRLKFITASDGHWGQPNTDFEGFHKNLFDAIHREKEVDFVVFNGDLIHDRPELLPEVTEFYRQLQVPHYVCRGNHDRVSEEDFQKIMGQTTNFSFESKGSGILLLDCSNEKGEYLCADLEYAKTILDKYANLEHVFVFVHISQNDWTRHGVDCKPFLDLVTSYPNVEATFHGHDHDVDGQMIYRKKPFLWSGHFGGNWGNPFPSYRVCEVGDDGKVISYLKTVKDGTILNGHTLNN
jgi:predicted phosphodiesterase